VTEIRIHFEGNEALRPGLHRFLSRIRDAAQARRIGFRLIAADGTPDPDFQTARKAHPNACNILLRDSEGPKPKRKKSVFWMVQVMEAWFLADPEALTLYYGEDFARNALKKNRRVEEIPKADVLKCLKQATRKTLKGPYHKTAHAPHILELLDPDKVRKAAPECDRLFHEILTELENSPAQGR
jgi:Domain of unknown function (DUF4276)